MKKPKYQIGDKIQYRLDNGAIQEGQIHMIKAVTHQIMENKQMKSVIIPDTPIGYGVFGTAQKITEDRIIKKLKNS